MKRFLLRMRNILFRPGQEWRVIGQDQTSAGNLIKPYALIMAALPPLAALAERLLGRNVAGRQPLTLVLATSAVWYVVILVNMVSAAAVFTVIIRSSQRRLIDL